MFEVWKIDGRHRVLVARFRIRSDAERYVGVADGDSQHEIVEPKAPTYSSIPPRSGRRTLSGVVVASEHPDEFIADQAEGDD